MNLVTMLLAEASAHPERSALVEGDALTGRTVTFGELARRVAAGVDWLRSMGLERGDAVLLGAPISIRLYEVLLALWHGGMTAVVVDPSAGRAGLELCCRRVPLAGFVAVPRAHWLRLLSPVVRKLRRAVVLGGWVPGARRWPERWDQTGAGSAEELPPEFPALITFTSGSTGEPKATVRSHGLLVAQYRVLAPILGFASGQVELATLPIFALASLASGVTTVLADADLRRPAEIDPARVLRQMRAHRVTRCTAAPAFLERLLDAEEARGATNGELECICTGGGPVFPRLLARLQRWAPRAAVSGVYGSTEVEPIAHLPARELREADWERVRAGRGVLAGRPVPGLALAIIAPRSGRDLPAMTAAEFAAIRRPAGQSGEIVVSGNHVLPGYLEGVGDREAKFKVEGVSWHRTGDAGYRDDDGRLWLLGRCAARIADDRGELYPFAVEGVAVETPGVRRAALAAVQGNRILALEPTADAVRIDLAALEAALAWARLDAIRLVRALPMDRRHNSKVDYTRLARELQQGETCGAFACAASRLPR